MRGLAIIMCALGISLGCGPDSDPAPKKKSAEKKAPAYKKPSEAELACRQEKTRMLARCQPRCESSDVSDDFDACLDECALEEFGVKMPMCTGL